MSVRSPTAPTLRAKEPPGPSPLLEHRRADGSSRLAREPFTGPVFGPGGPSIEDVGQGPINNCHLGAAAGSIAFMRPKEIERLFRTDEHGALSVSLACWQGDEVLGDVAYRVPTRLFVRSGGKVRRPQYGADGDRSRGPDKMIRWYPLLENAYAQLYGDSYEAINQGGTGGGAMSDLLGVTFTRHDVKTATADATYARIAEAAKDRLPMTGTTHGRDQAARFTNTGVYSWHTYSVLGVEEDAGKRWVKLRNPWGNAYSGGDGSDRGFLRIELEKFVDLFGDLEIADLPPEPTDGATA